MASCTAVTSLPGRPRWPPVPTPWWLYEGRGGPCLAAAWLQDVRRPGRGPAEGPSSSEPFAGQALRSGLRTVLSDPLGHTPGLAVGWDAPELPAPPASAGSLPLDMGAGSRGDLAPREHPPPARLPREPRGDLARPADLP